MSITAFSGPLVTFGQAPAGTGVPANQNPEQGPSIFQFGSGILDPRTPYTFYPGQNFGAPMYGFIGITRIPVLDVAPATSATTSVAASQTPSGAGSLTLVSSSAAGITAGVSIVRADTGATVTGLLAVGGAAGSVTFGSAATVHIWDPTKALARCLNIASGSDISNRTFTVSGYDIYGYPMTETITGPNNATVVGAKAFKYISGITISGAAAGAITVGLSDTIGLPIRADRFAEVDIFMNNAAITASTGFTAAVTTSPATATTGDVRGTYALQTASDGTKRVQIFASPSVANLSNASGLSVGLFGVTQA